MVRRRKRKLKVIPEPEPDTRVIFQPKVLPVIEAGGNTDLVCGNCGAILVEGTRKGQIRNIVFQCPVCRFYCEAS